MATSKVFLIAIVGTLGLPIDLLAEPLGKTVVISGSGCRFPDVAYNNARGEYFVVWADYTSSPRGIFGRRVSSDGTVVGDCFRISPPDEKEAYFPAVAYCQSNDEYLVTFDSSTVVQGQLIHGDGTLRGKSFAIGVTQGIRSAIAWSDKSKCCLIVYYAPDRGGAEVLARRIRLSHENRVGGELLGEELNLSQDRPYSGYPAIAYAADEDQFLVTWDHEPRENRGHIRGRRIAAGTGELLGDPFDIAASGADSRSCIAYDSMSERWLVQYNSARTRENSYDQYGRFVATDSTLGDEIPIATSTLFEGDTLFGGDVAYVPNNKGCFFSSFARDGDAGGMAGQVLGPDGMQMDGQVELAIGPYTSLNNAADARMDRVLTVWEGLDGKTHSIRGRIFACDTMK